VNRIDQETEKDARAHKGCRAIQEEEEEEEWFYLLLCVLRVMYVYSYILSRALAHNQFYQT
jgi:hypothetical protein